MRSGAISLDNLSQVCHGGTKERTSVYAIIEESYDFLFPKVTSPAINKRL